MPHWKFAADIFGTVDTIRGLCLQIENMDVGQIASPVAFPAGSELGGKPHLGTHYQGHLFSVWRIRTIFCKGHGQFFSGATGSWYGIKLVKPRPATFAQGSKQHLFVIVCPVNYPVAITMGCYAYRHTTGSRYNIYVIVTIVIAGEGNAFSVC